LYRTIPIEAKFNEEEKAFWVDQCEHANSLINCAVYHTRQSHYAQLEQQENAFRTYWREDELCYGWKTYKCQTFYPEQDKVLKENPHYKAMAAQSAQQTLQTVGESIVSYNGLVSLYYTGEVDRPSLLKYRKKGGLAIVTFPRQALNYKDGCFYPSISRQTKPHLITDIALPLPEFKVATQLGINLAEVGREALTLPQRFDLFRRLDKSYRKRCVAGLEDPLRNIRLESPCFQRGEMSTLLVNH